MLSLSSLTQALAVLVGILCPASFLIATYQQITKLIAFIFGSLLLDPTIPLLRHNTRRPHLAAILIFYLYLKRISQFRPKVLS